LLRRDRPAGGVGDEVIERLAGSLDEEHGRYVLVDERDVRVGAEVFEDLLRLGSGTDTAYDVAGHGHLRIITMQQVFFDSPSYRRLR
jgi:hypothetical protein